MPITTRQATEIAGTLIAEFESAVAAGQVEDGQAMVEFEAWELLQLAGQVSDNDLGLDDLHDAMDQVCRTAEVIGSTSPIRWDDGWAGPDKIRFLFTMHVE